MLITRRSESGFTLMETLAAVTVFAIMTLGIAPLLAASIRGTTVARSDTVAKNIASQAMERVRGLPYFVSTDDVDVTDLYFPTTDGGAGDEDGVANDIFTTICQPADATRACPADTIPANHTVTYEAAFVNGDGGTPEQYIVQDVPAGYDADTAAESPNGNDLLRMVITVTWPVGNENRTYTLTSLIGDRRFGGLKVDGSAVLEHGVQITTAFRNPSGQESSLTAVGGASQSRIEDRLLTTADQDLVAATLLLTDRTVPTDAEADIPGADIVLSAPPGDGPLTESVLTVQELQHLDLANAVVAGIGASRYGGVAADVTNDLPLAEGDHEVLSNASAPAALWVDTQADDGATSPLRLDDRGMVAWLRPDPATPLSTTALSARTEALTEDLATQEVSTAASVNVASFLLLPTTFIPPDATATGAEEAVVEVRDFQADVACLARPAARGGGSATATWSATLRYWQDPADEPSGAVAGSYQEEPLGTQTAADRLEAIQANPPIVYEDPTSTDPLGSPDDIYLFEPPAADHTHASHADDDDNPLTPSDNDEDGDPLTLDTPVTHDHQAYLADWVALGSTTTDAAEDQAVSANISNALQITTTPTDPTLLESVLSITFGSLNCNALDGR